MVAISSTATLPEGSRAIPTLLGVVARFGPDTDETEVTFDRPGSPFVEGGGTRAIEIEPWRGGTGLVFLDPLNEGLGDLPCDPMPANPSLLEGFSNVLLWVPWI